MILPGFIKESKALKIPDYRRQKSNLFMGAFYVDGSNLNGVMTVQVDRGYVNGLEPVSESGDLIGGNDDSQPYLNLKAKYDSMNRCYICIKLQIDPASGLMVARTQADVTPINLTIEAVDDFHSDDPAIHYHPIALEKKEQGFRQLAYHDLLHVSVKQYGAFRHFMVAS